MQGALKSKTKDGSEENATCIAYLKKKPSSKSNKLSTWDLCATRPPGLGFSQWSCAPLSANVHIVDSWLKARKKKHIPHITSSLVEPYIQSQKGNHQLITEPWRNLSHSLEGKTTRETWTQEMQAGAAHKILGRWVQNLGKQGSHSARNFRLLLKVLGKGKTTWDQKSLF